MYHHANGSTTAEPNYESSAPFDYAEADIILLSTDGAEFRLFTLFLFPTSPFFESVFFLPQGPNGGNSDQETKDGFAVIPISEDSKLQIYFSGFAFYQHSDDPLS
ncbi:uncharacterized protein F5147DRAFT_809576 [Suillus discolor]|uniref:BTB domain-containing protein n=1 Tax=Suillus discolor TaxID=1912936 RepID=A0A9P7F347_9AGAM|nr:uncharacterized protein F5147DRAFT_809576 [Suillus discolor]KAG2103111.1 hypothetical protein F5147DRAFT_809576 [Suillus discolor]